MLVRAFSPADRNACLRIFDSNVGAFFAVEERHDFCAFLADLPGPYLVVEDEQGQVVACGGYAVDREAGRADLCWGMVQRERQGQGIGRLLLRERLRRLHDDPEVKTVRLDTSQKTLSYYERAGFRVVQVTPDGYAPGLDRCDMVLKKG